MTLTGSSLARHVALPDHGVGLDGQSCSCLIVGWPVGLFISNPGCWMVDRSCSCLIVGRLIDLCLGRFGGVTPTACFEHSNFFKVTAPEARPGQLRPGAYRRQERQADRCSPKADRATHPKHTEDVRGRPSAHTGCPAVHQYTYQHAPWTVRVILAHVGCLFSTHRTSVSTRRTSVAVRVCPCDRQCTQDVRQHTQDVRQHTQDVRQHTQDIRGCPCVSVCPSAHAGRPSVHTGRPSAHKGRPWPSVSTHRTSVAVRQHTQDVRQYTEDVRGCPSAHTGRPSAHAGRPWLSVCVRVSVSTHRTSVSTHRTSVSTHRTSVAVRQYTQDVRGRPSVHISACWPFLWTVRVILAHVGCLFSTHRTSVSTRRTSVSTRRTSVPVH
ncbi:hypothetical protein YC2023_071593 [Brassica napus]